MAKGFKIVGLAIDVQRHETVPALEASKLLRQAAWYPHVPSEQICLNTSWLWCPQFLNTSFRPLIWLDFGGPGGKYLSYITGLSVQYRHGLHSIEFHYKQTPCTRASKKLGRCDTSEVAPSTLFKIDGGSGERITAVDIVVQKPRALQAADAMLYEALKGVQVSVLWLYQ